MYPSTFPGSLNLGSTTVSAPPSSRSQHRHKLSGASKGRVSHGLFAMAIRYASKTQFVYADLNHQAEYIQSTSEPHRQLTIYSSLNAIIMIYRISGTSKKKG